MTDDCEILLSVLDTKNLISVWFYDALGNRQ